jgi:hypothetical protein
MKSHSNASGQGAEKASHDSTIASDTSSYTRTTAHLYVMVAGSHLHGLMPSIVIVRCPIILIIPVLIIVNRFSAL